MLTMSRILFAVGVFVVLSVFVLRDHHTEYLYAEYRHTEYLYAEHHYAEYHYAEYCYAEYRYAELPLRILANHSLTHSFIHSFSLTKNLFCKSNER
jgi:hypothetical protein